MGNEVLNGGAGSGDFDHAGRPGLVGGSEPTESRAKRGFKSKSEKYKKAVEERHKYSEIVKKHEQAYKDFEKGKISMEELNKVDKEMEKATKDFYGKEKSEDKQEAERKEVKKEEKQETKDKITVAEKQYNDILKKYNDAKNKVWGKDRDKLTTQQFYDAYDEMEKSKKDLTKVRREYAESIMDNFENSGDKSHEEKQQKTRDYYLEQAKKYTEEANKYWQSGFTWDKASKLQEKAKYYESKAKGVGKSGISSDDKNAIGKLAQKYKSNITSAEKRRIIDRVIELHKNSKVSETSKKDENFDNLGFNVQRNSDANRLQLHFEGVPDENTRSILKHQGFRWSPTNKAWQRQLGGNSEYALKRVVEELKGTVKNSYKHEFIEY